MALALAALLVVSPAAAAPVDQISAAVDTLHGQTLEALDAKRAKKPAKALDKAAAALERAAAALAEGRDARAARRAAKARKAVEKYLRTLRKLAGKDPDLSLAVSPLMLAAAEILASLEEGIEPPDTVAPVVAITDPPDGALVGTSPVVVAGTVDDPGATVTVNGVAAVVVDGRFSAEVPLAEGANPITALAEDAAGNVGRADVTVTLAAGPSPTITLGPVVDRLADGFVPCRGPMGLAFEVKAENVALEPPPRDLAYAMEAEVTYVDQSGRRAVQREGRQLTGESAYFTFGFDGITYSGPSPSFVGPGAITVLVDVSLLELTRLADGTTATRLLDTASAVVNASAVAPEPRCAAWLERLPGFAPGPDHTLIVNGRETTLRPRATWRDGRVVGLVGNLTPPGSAADLDTVIGFVNQNAALYSGEPVPPGQLRLIGEFADPNGATRLVIGQGQPDFEGLATAGRMTARFDADGSLVALTGRVLPGLNGFVPRFLQSIAAGADAVRQDLIARGLDPNRSIVFDGLEIFGDGPATYEGAYRFLVGGGPSAPVEAGSFVAGQGEGDLLTFRYLVSTESAAVLDVRTLTFFQSTQATVRDIAIRDPDYLEPLLDPLFDPAVGFQHPAPRRLRADREVRIDSDNSPLILRDVNHPAGVIDGARARFVADTLPVPEDFTDDILNIDFETTTGVFEPVPCPFGAGCIGLLPEVYQLSYRGAYRAFYQIQKDWEARYAPWAPGARDVFIFLSNRNIGTSLFSSGSYRARPDEPTALISLQVADVERPAATRTAAHELVHHLDESTAALLVADRVTDDHRMPGAIKEGIAQFLGRQVSAPHPVDNTHQLQATQAETTLLCAFSALAGTPFWECVDNLNSVFRAHAVGFDPFHRATLPGRSLLEPWPDCRIAGFFRCFVVRPRGTPGSTFRWKGSQQSVESEYELVPQVLLDAWETSATHVAAGSSPAIARTYANEIFPELVLGALVALPSDASLVDLWFELQLQAFLNVSLTNLLPPEVAVVPEREIVTAFQRHGIDFDLWVYCNAAANQPFCH